MPLISFFLCCHQVSSSEQTHGNHLQILRDVLKLHTTHSEETLDADDSAGAISVPVLMLVLLLVLLNQYLYWYFQCKYWCKGHLRRILAGLLFVSAEQDLGGLNKHANIIKYKYKYTTTNMTTVTQTKNTHMRTKKKSWRGFCLSQLRWTWEVLTKIIKYIYDSFLYH